MSLTIAYPATWSSARSPGIRRPGFPITAASSISQSSCEVSGGIKIVSLGPTTVLLSLMNMYGLLSAFPASTVPISLACSI